MNRFRWRQLASALAVATLSLGIAACDDDTTGGTGDMAMMMGADMSVPDLAMAGQPGIGQITLADIVGTLFTTLPAPLDTLYRTHMMIALAKLPKFVPTSDPSSDLQLVPPSGCTVNRFTTTNPGSADGDGGKVTISGWNQAVYGMSLTTQAKVPGSAIYPITCQRGGPLMTYDCQYGAGFFDGGTMGDTWSDVIFPELPNMCVVLNPVTHMPTNMQCPNSPAPQLPPGFPCSPRYAYNSAETQLNAACTAQTWPASCTTAIQLCEQSPLLPGTSNITEDVAGGADYAAQMAMLGDRGDGQADAGGSEFPQPLYLLAVKSGTSDITGTEPPLIATGGPSLSMADHAIATNADLEIDFSCDGSSTVGGGCNMAATSDIAALLVSFSKNPKTSFSLTQLPSGSAQCISGLASGKIKIKAAQLAALVGTTTGGSFQLALARLRLDAMSNSGGGGHLLAFTGGQGVFGFTNQ